MLKDLKVIISMQKQIQNIIKIIEEINTTVIKIKKTILKTSINN